MIEAVILLLSALASYLLVKDEKGGERVFLWFMFTFLIAVLGYFVWAANVSGGTGWTDFSP